MRHFTAYAHAENVCAYVEQTGARRCGSEPVVSKRTPSLFDSEEELP